MCGITGVFFLKKDKNFNFNSLKEMTSSLSHRGPDSYGYWSSEENNIYFGHRRLSILDLSKNGDQPMTSSCGRFVITFNGEIYNFKELSRELRDKFSIRKHGTPGINNGHSNSNKHKGNMCEDSNHSILEDV